MPTFKKLSDKRKTCIVQGEVGPGQFFSVTRFICEVTQQETEEETQAVADMLLQGLLFREIQTTFLKPKKPK